MDNFVAKRVIGAIMFCVGIGIAFWLKSAHDTGGTIHEDVVIFAPILILSGLSYVVNPSLLIWRGQWGTVPMGTRVLSVVISLIGVAIGFWLRYAVFKDWTTVSH